MASRAFIIASTVLAMVLGACRTSRQPDVKPDIKTDPVIQTKSEPALKVVERASFTGLVEHVSMYPVPNRREDLALSLVVSASNAGAPSIAQGWKLEVNSPGKLGSAVLDTVHINGYVEMPGSDGKKVDLAKEDMVFKTARVPIAKGARVNGILTFVLSKTSEKELASNHSSFILHFKDSQGNAYRTRKVMIGEKVARSDNSPGVKGTKP